MSAPLPDPELTMLDGKYSILRELASGGGGTIYEAEHLVVGKRVALKILNQGIADDPEFRARFVAEARAAARIAHANVVDIHDLGVTPEGAPYIVMELIEGETLRELVDRRGALPSRFCCELVLQLLDGVIAAHRMGVIHCDLKPANVMVTYPAPDRPLVKVLDFGVALGLNEPSLARPGTVIGTPMFMAPEQVCGQPLDERTDVYGASAILYWLLTSVDPFPGTSSPEVMERVARGELRRIADVRPEVPTALAAIVETGMARKRRERFATAEELSQQLRQYLQLPVQADVAAPAPSVRGAAALALQAAPPLQLVSLTEKQRYGSRSDVPESHVVVRVGPTPRLVTDSLLMSPRLPKPPASPKLQLGRDFMPLPGDPSRAADSQRRSLTTATPRPRSGITAALLAMLAGFAIGVLIAWLAGLI